MRLFAVIARASLVWGIGCASRLPVTSDTAKLDVVGDGSFSSEEVAPGRVMKPFADESSALEVYAVRKVSGRDETYWIGLGSSPWAKLDLSESAARTVLDALNRVPSTQPARANGTLFDIAYADSIGSRQTYFLVNREEPGTIWVARPNENMTLFRIDVLRVALTDALSDLDALKKTKPIAP